MKKVKLICLLGGALLPHLLFSDDVNINPSTTMDEYNFYSQALKDAQNNPNYSNLDMSDIDALISDINVSDPAVLKFLEENNITVDDVKNFQMVSEFEQNEKAKAAFREGFYPTMDEASYKRFAQIILINNGLSDGTAVIIKAGPLKFNEALMEIVYREYDSRIAKYVLAISKDVVVKDPVILESGNRDYTQELLTTQYNENYLSHVDDNSTVSLVKNSIPIVDTLNKEKPNLYFTIGVGTVYFDLLFDADHYKRLSDKYSLNIIPIAANDAKLLDTVQLYKEKLTISDIKAIGRGERFIKLEDRLLDEILNNKAILMSQHSLNTTEKNGLESIFILDNEKVSLEKLLSD